MAKIKVCNWRSPAWRARNKPMAKMGREQLERALASHDRIQAISDEIRARHGLEPVPENQIIQAARERMALLATREAGKRTRKPSRATSREKLTSAELAADLAKRKRAWKRDGEALDAEIAALAASGDLGATRLARALGVSRQRVYQLAAAA